MFRNNNETTLYFFRTPDSSLVCTIDEEYLTDVDIYRENQTQQMLAGLTDEIEYFNTVKLSDMQRGKLLVQKAISECTDFWK